MIELRFLFFFPSTDQSAGDRLEQELPGILRLDDPGAVVERDLPDQVSISGRQL